VSCTCWSRSGPTARPAGTGCRRGTVGLREGAQAEVSVQGVQDTYVQWVHSLGAPVTGQQHHGLGPSLCHALAYDSVAKEYPQVSLPVLGAG
jgi:hypothetical protein